MVRRRRLPPPEAVTPITRFLRPSEGPVEAAKETSPPHKIRMPPRVLRETTQTSICEFFAVRRSSRRPGKTLAEERLRSLQEAVATLTEDHLVVRNFEGKGRGVVSTRDIEKGEVVVEYAGELISLTEAKQREGLYAADQNTGCYMYYFTHNAAHYCVDATAESGRLGRLVNHSRWGNLQPRTVEVKQRPRLVLVAKEAIASGRELLYDYGDRSRDALINHPWLAS